MKFGVNGLRQHILSWITGVPDGAIGGQIPSHGGFRSGVETITLIGE